MTNFECIATSIMVLLMLNSASAAVNTTLVSSICNGDEYTAIENFALNRDWVLKDLKAETAKNGFDYYTTSDGSISQPCYGHGACAGELTHDECTDCLSFTISRMTDECGNSIGVQYQMQDCRVRYEKYPFQE